MERHPSGNWSLLSTKLITSVANKERRGRVRNKGEAALVRLILVLNFLSFV